MRVVKLSVVLIGTVTLAATNADLNECDEVDVRGGALDRILFKETQCEKPTPGEMPPERIPDHMFNAFSRDGRIPVVYDEESFVDDSFEGQGSYYAYSAADVGMFGARAEEYEPVVAEMLRSHPRLVTKVAVFGSQKPILEGLLLRLGAKQIFTIEYNRLRIEHPRVQVFRGNRLPEEIKRVRLAVVVDALQHDGLGRYGDPLCPDADLIVMDHLREKASYVLLSIPTGQDTIIWNAHRIYGKERLPLLLEGWQIEDSLPYQTNTLNRTVFLLRANKESPSPPIQVED